MDQDFTAILLAGGLRVPPLQQSLRIPPAALPLDDQVSLGQAWMRLLEKTGRCAEVRILVSRDSDASVLREHTSGEWRTPIRVQVDGEHWRGTAGVMRDVTRHLPCSMRVLGLEASSLPPRSLGPILDTALGSEAILVGVDSRASPSGVFSVTAGALDATPPVGFFDLKEQFLASAIKRGVEVRTAVLSEKAICVRTRSDYLEAVSAVSGDQGDATSALNRRESVVQEGASVHDSAIVVKSVIMAGATIGQGTVIARSVIGPGVCIEPNCRVVDQVVSHHRPRPQRALLRRFEGIVTHPIRRVREQGR